MLEVRYRNEVYSCPSVSEALAVFRKIHGPTVYLSRTPTHRGWRAEIKRDGVVYFLGDIKDPTRHVMTPAFVNAPLNTGHAG